MKIRHLLIILSIEISGLFFYTHFINAQLPICDRGATPLNQEPPGCLICKDTLTAWSGNSFPFIPKNPSCLTIESPSFFTLFSDSSGNIKFELDIRFCTDTIGLEGILYDQYFNEASDCFSVAVIEDTKLIIIENLVPNEFYYLMTDEVNDNLCYFDIFLKNNLPISSGQPNDAREIKSSHTNFNDLCVGEEFCFSIDSVPNATSYYWNIPFFFTPTFKNKHELCVIVNNLGGALSGIINVTPFNGCISGATSPDIRLTLNKEQFRYNLVEVCPGKFPYFFRDSIYEDFGRYLYPESIPPPNVCSLLYITLEIIPLLFEERTILIDTTICVSDSIKFRNEFYDSPGIYEFILPSSHTYDCDSTFKLTLEISGDLPPQIQCLNDTFLNVFSINWDKIRLADGYFVLINGDTVSDQSHRGFFYTPNQFGEQIDIKIQPYNSHGCSFEAGFASCFVEPTTAVFEKDLGEKIRVFPNPSDGIFQIESAISIKKIQVLNVLGEKIFEGNSNKIDLDQFPRGIYFFVIKTLRKTAVRKVLKN